MIIEYTVVHGYTVPQVIGKVTELISKGWRPLGGITYANDMFYQAMTVNVYSEDITI